MKNVLIGAVCGAIGVIVCVEVCKAKSRAYIDGYKDGVDVCMMLLKSKIKEDATIEEEGP